jgi:very-short-patch-repair endonuclease
MGSPIEGRMFDALCAAAERRGVLLQEPLEDVVFHGCRRASVRSVWLTRNEAIASYRIDILVGGAGWKLAIECDGHDFHDRTKQQAAYDRARDRELVLLGVTTIRFTGSEITHSAERCADEAIRVLEYLDDRDHLLRELLERCGETEPRRRSL